MAYTCVTVTATNNEDIIKKYMLFLKKETVFLILNFLQISWF